MTVQVATLSFSLPEDVDASTIRLWSCATRDAAYNLEFEDATYQYGTITYEYNALDDQKWYKVQFYNPTTAIASPLSEPVYGGDYANAAGFLAVSDTTSGANYASTEDVYDFAGLTVADVPMDIVSTALKRARALIDFRTTNVDLLRFTQFFPTDVARRKYNSTLRLVKEAEICFALETIYYRLSDSKIISNFRDSTTSGATAGSVSIGDVMAQGDSIAERSENIVYLATLAAKYGAMANSLLDSLQQTSVQLTGYDYVHRFPRFLYPFQVVR